MKSVMTVSRLLVVVCLSLFAVVTAKAQCAPTPTRETAVGIRNASDYFIIFYIDGERKGSVPANDRSVDFVVSPGEHVLMAEALIGAETATAPRKLIMPAGSVCTWNVTNPRKTASPAGALLGDSLERTAVIPLVIPN